MSASPWEVVFEAQGQLEAEMLRGLLEAQDIPVVLSQEGIGRVYGLTVGPLGLVQLLVPATESARARKILQSYLSADIEPPDWPETESD